MGVGIAMKGRGHRKQSHSRNSPNRVLSTEVCWAPALHKVRVQGEAAAACGTSRDRAGRREAWGARRFRPRPGQGKALHLTASTSKELFKMKCTGAGAIA